MKIHREHLVIFVFYMSGVIAATLRSLGKLAGVPILTNTLPIQAINGAIAVWIFLSIFKKKISGHLELLYILSFFLLSSLIFIHFIGETKVNSNSWNTTPFELARSFSIGMYFYVIFSLSGRGVCNKKTVGKWIIISNFILFVYSALQVLGIFPQFYYQWYNGIHLPRPTGGLEHPHFYAVLLLISMSTAWVLRADGLIGKGWLYFVYAYVPAGILISTSRVGAVSLVVLISTYILYKKRMGTKMAYFLLSVFTLGFLAVVIALNWSSLKDTAIGRNAEVFVSAFEESFGGGDEGDGQFLRGRGSRWAHEIDLITQNALTLTVGYGHQPFVSHNLILRQMQVSGIIGTISYLAMLICAGTFWLRSAQQRYLPAIKSIFWALGVASITFPVLVSVPIMSGLICLAVITICQDRKMAD